MFYPAGDFGRTAGHRAIVDLAGTTYGLAHLQLRAPDGEPLLFEEGLFGERVVGDVVPRTGTYTLSIDPLEQQAGSVTATLYVSAADHTGPLTIGGPPKTMALAPAQQAHRPFHAIRLSGPTGHLTGLLAITGEYVLHIFPTPPASGSLTAELD